MSPSASGSSRCAAETSKLPSRNEAIHSFRSKQEKVAHAAPAEAKAIVMEVCERALAAVRAQAAPSWY